MREDYLWDRSGPPDPDIERLEVELGSLRYRFGRNQPGARRQRAPGAWLAAAAAVLLAAGALLFRSASAPAAPTAWRMGNLAVLQGQVLRTGDLGVTLESEPVGRVELGPGSELRAATSRHLELRRGRLHAFIWAPPREFVVETASAQAVDLGCEYTLDVDGAGNGMPGQRVRHESARVRGFLSTRTRRRRSPAHWRRMNRAIKLRCPVCLPPPDHATVSHSGICCRVFRPARAAMSSTGSRS
jgi:hypothetical protein